MIGPLIQLINPNIINLHAFAGAGFHNLLVVSLKERHPQERLKTAMSLLGTGQLSLTKVLIMVGPHQATGHFAAVLRDSWHRFDPEDHMWLLPVARLDPLDFTSLKMHVASKRIIQPASHTINAAQHPRDIDPTRCARRIDKCNL